ncbi:MAG: bifunctional DNA-formamidopyrimidine glycosylase/DNA-(apurinic or apyrimidinic site) lyase [Chloroflexota bacterium]
MPELPEVETTAAELRERLVGRIVKDVSIVWDRSIGYPEAGEFAARLPGRAITAVGRRAKYVVIALESAERLVVHMRMTGQLLVDEPGVPPPRFERAALVLDNGCTVRFADQRKFGRLYLVTAEEFAAGLPFPLLGPEPLEDSFTLQSFTTIMRRRRGVLKPLLLDQSVVAGLGNIYVDEALHHARLHPQRRAESLTPDEIARLHGAIRLVLARGVASKGTTFSTYRTTWGLEGLNQHNLQVFRRTGEPCYPCGTPISRIVLGGRGTHFCSSCQGQPREG